MRLHAMMLAGRGGSCESTVNFPLHWQAAKEAHGERQRDCVRASHAASPRVADVNPEGIFLTRNVEKLEEIHTGY